MFREWQFWLVAAGFGLTILIWVTMLTSTGSIDYVDDGGFVIATRLFTRRHVDWNDIRSPAWRMRVIRPRILIGRKTRGFLQLHSGYTIVLHDSATEDAFIEELARRVEIREANNPADFFRR